MFFIRTFTPVIAIVSDMFLIFSVAESSSDATRINMFGEFKGNFIFAKIVFRQMECVNIVGSRVTRSLSLQPDLTQLGACIRNCLLR